MREGNRTHVSGIKSIAGTEKILVLQKLIHNVKQEGKKEGRWTKKALQGADKRQV